MKLKKKGIFFFLWYVALFCGVIYRLEEINDLLAYTSQKNIVVIVSFLSLIIYSVFLFLRRTRINFFFTSLGLCLLILPSLFPLSIWNTHWDSLLNTFRPSYSCPRPESSGGFEFSFGSEVSVATIDHEEDEPSESDVNSKPSDTLHNELYGYIPLDKLETPCLGRYVNEPLLSFLKRNFKMKILQLRYQLKHFSLKGRMNALGYYVYLTGKGYFPIRSHGPYYRPSVHSFINSEDKEEVLAKAQGHLLFTETPVKSKFSKLNVHNHVIEEKFRCSNPRFKNVIVKSLKLDKVDSFCKRSLFETIRERCQKRISNGLISWNIGEGECSETYINKLVKKYTYSESEEKYCNNDSFYAHHVVLCFSDEVGPSFNFSHEKRTIKVHSVLWNDDPSELVKNISKTVLRDESIVGEELMTQKATLLSQYEPFLLKRLNIFDANNGFKFINDRNYVLNFRSFIEKNYRGLIQYQEKE